MAQQDTETAGEMPDRWRALVGISLISFIVFVDFTIVNTILPGIQRDLHASMDQLQWVINAFVLMLTVCMVTMGRVGDIYGRRKVQYAGAIVFALASFAAGLSPSPEFLIACRLVQGITGAILLTCAVGLVNHHFPKEEQGRALAIFMSITGFGMAIGPVLGGAFLSWASWRWAFYVNVPVVIVGFAIGLPAIRETPRQWSEKVDWLGLSVMTPGITALLIAIMRGNEWGWTSPYTLGMAAAAVILLGAFVVVERRVAQPIIRFELFRHPNFLACSVIAITLGGFITVGTFFAALYLQTVRNEPPLIAGLMLLPISALVVIVPPLIGKLVDDLGPMRFIFAGQVCLAVSALLQIFFLPNSPALFVIIGLGLFGLGWGLQQASSAVAATSPFAPERASLVIGVLYSVWNVGSGVGLAIAGTVFEILEKRALDASLAANGVSITGQDRHLVHSLLSDPSQARTALSSVSPGLEDKILPLFQDAFMTGYGGAMWYLLVTCATGAVLVAVITWGRRAAGPPGVRESGQE